MAKLDDIIDFNTVETENIEETEILVSTLLFVY